MKYDKTDKIISEKYLSVEPDFDAEVAWSQLEPKINRKKRRGFWLWYMAGISLLIFFFFFQLIDDDGNSASKIPENLTDENEAFLRELPNKSIADANEKQNYLVNEFENSSQPLSSLDIDSKSTTDKKDKDAENDRYLNSKEKEHPIARMSIRNQENSEFENRFFEKKEPNILEDHVAEKEMKRVFISFAELPTQLSNLESNRDISGSLDYSPMFSISHSSKKNSIRIGVFGGYFIHSRSLSHSGLGNAETYESRVAEEEAIDAFDLGLKLDYFINDNLVVFGGLRYDLSYVERNADYVYLESITVPDQTLVIVETENGPQEQKGDITYDGYYVHKANNYLTTKRMGVLAGVQYRIGSGKWKSTINLGVEIPFSTSLSGIITNEGKPYNLSDGELEISKSSPLIFGGVGGEYAISEGLGIQVLIGGYLPFNNEYSESYNIIKKSTQLGVNLGMHFQL